DGRFAIVRAEDRVVGQVEFEQQTARVPVFGNVRDAELLDRAGGELADLATFERRAAARGAPQPGQNLDQFGLPVAFDARNPHDLARADLERNVVELRAVTQVFHGERDVARLGVMLFDP